MYNITESVYVQSTTTFNLLRYTFIILIIYLQEYQCYCTGTLYLQYLDYYKSLIFYMSI